MLLGFLVGLAWITVAVIAYNSYKHRVAISRQTQLSITTVRATLTSGTSDGLMAATAAPSKEATHLLEKDDQSTSSRRCCCACSRNCVLAWTLVVLVSYLLAGLIVGCLLAGSPAAIWEGVMPVVVDGDGWTWRPHLGRRVPDCTLESLLASPSRCADDPALDVTSPLTPAPNYDAATGQCSCPRTRSRRRLSLRGHTSLPALRTNLSVNPTGNETDTACQMPSWHDPAQTAAHPEATFVTAYADLGRTNRPSCEYFAYMLSWFRVDCNLVVYCAPEHVPLLRSIRNHYGYANKTIFREIRSWTDVPFSELLDGMYTAVFKQLMSHAMNGFRSGTVEHYIPEYGLINHAKVGFVRDVVVTNPFNSSYFFWVDAGAGRGCVQFRSPWCPCIAAVDGLVTFGGNEQDVAVTTPQWYFEGGASGPGMYTDHYSEPVGGMWGGGASGLLRFHELYAQLLRNMTSDGFADDDQVLYDLLFHRSPQLFRHGHLLDTGFFPFRAFC